MADKYVFADEAGNFDFSTNQGASRHFVLATVTLDDCQIGKDLLDLRRELAWNGVYLDRVFHASEDEQAVRDKVFQLLAGANFRVDATILESARPNHTFTATLRSTRWRGISTSSTWHRGS